MNFKHVLLIAFLSICALAVFVFFHTRPVAESTAPADTPSDLSRLSPADVNRLVDVTVPANTTSRELLGAISEKLHQRLERATARPHEAVLSFKTPEAYRAFVSRADQAGLPILSRIDAFNTVRVQYDSLNSLARDLLDNAADYDQIAANFFMTPPATAPQAQARAARTQVAVGNALLQSVGVVANNTGWGNGVTIAVLDTGVAADATFGIGRLKTLDIGLGTTPAPGSEGGHATAVASLAAGQAQDALGIAPSASLLSIRVAADDGKSDAFSVAQGIVAAVDAGASIINVSLGGYGTNSALDTAIAYAASRGVAVVASAGNDQAGQLTWPAADSHVISVGAVDANGTQVIFSNSSPQLQITAPGLGLQTAWSDGSRVSFSGTSGSAPIVAGAIAAVMSQDPSLSPTQAWEALVSHTNEAGAPGADPDYGNGVLNLGWAIARNDTTRADTAVASLYYDNANEQLQIVLQNRSAQGVAGLDLHIDVNGTLQHYPVSWLAAGASAIVNLPLSSSQLSAAGKVTVRTELVNPSGLNDVLPANNVRTKVLNGPPNSSAR